MRQLRRRFLQAGSSLCLSSLAFSAWPSSSQQGKDRKAANSFSEQFVSPTHSLVPVVADGKWISAEPPDPQFVLPETETSTGYFEPRSFDLTVQIRLTGTGTARDVSAFTVAPVRFPEQQLIDLRIEQHGCRAIVQPLTDTSARLMLSAQSIVRGQTISAMAHYRLRISKSYFGYKQEMFPEVQELPRIAKQYLSDSPGIRASSREVRTLAKTLTGQGRHPWELAATFHRWVWENIEGRPQDYTSVETAIKKQVGDCEERAAVFVALCRACGIPARLVWVPNHNWAEFLLTDEMGEAHWIPSHTAAYPWFGWTGVHELVLQKGDRIPLPGSSAVRLIYDNIRCSGSRPDVLFTAELSPVGESEQTAGPGARQKQPSGQWQLVGQHAAQKYMRV